MKDNEPNEPSKRKRSAFTVMNNIRDHCQQRGDKKVLMFSIGLYCDADGICRPGNRKLANAIHKSQRTVKRMVKELAAAGELEILTTGGGNQPRILRLTRYVAIAPGMPLGGGDTLDVTGVVTPLHRRSVHNNHLTARVKAKPTKKGRATRTGSEPTLADTRADYYLNDQIYVRVPSEAIRQPSTRLERARRVLE